MPRLIANRRLQEAEAMCRRQLAANPADPQAFLRLGEVAAAHGAWDAAASLFARCLQRDPGLLAGYRNLGQALAQQRRFAEARKIYEGLIARAPGDGEAHSNLGAMLGSLGDFEGACRVLQRAVELRPDFAASHNNLGVALARVGRIDEAVAAYRRAIVLAPDYRDARCNLIFALDLAPDTDSAQQRSARREWGDRLVSRYAARRLRHDNAPDPERPLRIGYVSPDFRRHAVATVALPLFRYHDRREVEVVAYFNDTRRDEVTTRFAEMASAFHEVAGWSDDRLAAQIRADGIDVLVDLAGPSLGGRLELFAMKPAPVQFSGFGYGAGSTGLSTVDGFFTDAVQAPALRADGAVEDLIELPCLFAFEPPTDAPPVTPLPLRRRGRPTFGSFNRLSKVSPRALDLWAAAMAAVPTAHLLVKASELDSPGERERLTSELGARGVASERLDLRGASSRNDHLETIAEVDLILDTTPQTGSVTTAEALWMGVPVLTLLGDRPAGRVSASLQHAVGLDRFVVEMPDEFGAHAAELLSDVPALAASRKELRERMARTPFVQGRPLVAALEANYRAYWRQWCQRRKSRAA